MWRSEFPLRLGDLDGLGHLTASAYLALFEETRAAWMMATLGVDYPSYVVASQSIEYRHEVTLGDGCVTVDLAVENVRTSSFVVVEHLSTPAQLCARSTATLVMWDSQERCSRHINAHERSVFEAALTP